MSDEERKPEGREAEMRVRREYCEGLYEQYHEQIQYYFAKRVKNYHDVEDLMQKVFLNLAAHRGDLENPHAYLFAIAQHQLFFYWRCHRRSVLAQQVLSQISEVPVDGDPELDPQKRMSDQEMYAAVNAMVAELTPALNEALRLRYFEGLKLKAAAGRAGCSCIALGKRLERARQSLLNGWTIAGGPLFL